MPFQSKAQMRTMHAVANDPSGAVADATGIDPASAKRFIKHAGKQNIGKLPEHAPRRRMAEPEGKAEPGDSPAEDKAEGGSSPSRVRPKSSPFVLKRKHG